MRIHTLSIAETGHPSQQEDRRNRILSDRTGREWRVDRGRRTNAQIESGFYNLGFRFRIVQHLW